jgi:GT2 family glycosyltransferase
MSNGITISVLCGHERSGWILPGLAARLFECLGDSMKERRPMATNFIEGVHPVEKARNQAVTEFLKSPCQWLLMLDNDVLPPKRFLHLFSQAETEGVFVFGLPTPMLGEAGLVWNVANKSDEQGSANFYNTLPSGWNRCDLLGGAFLAVRRPVFETLKGEWFDRMGSSGEDFSFCKRAQAAGFRPWFNGDHQCDHLHNMSMLESIRGKSRAAAQ